ncbi:hypothetical protein EDB84DRAFT_1438085 [Lactarius hengduanensis]|nr:hypothetical protein EDB84DRAFT_1438085 [Lactarius hengduanensis]
MAARLLPIGMCICVGFFRQSWASFRHHEGLVPASAASKDRRFSLGDGNIHLAFDDVSSNQSRKPLRSYVGDWRERGTYQKTKNRCALVQMEAEDLERYSGVRTPSREWGGKSEQHFKLNLRQRVSWNGSRAVVEVFERSLGNQKVTRTSWTPGRLDMVTDTHPRGLASACGLFPRRWA